MSAVSVVIPSFNGSALLARFLPDLSRALEAEPGEHQVVVVDNASSDDTVAMLKERHPSVEVVELEENLGFGPAVNAGLKSVRHPWVLCLNNDIRVEPDFLGPLLEAAKEEALFAAVPRILLPRFGGRVESVMEGEFRDGFIEATQPGLAVRGPSFPEPRKVLFSVGGASLFHTERLRELGGFDPVYFPFYWEDVDLGYRAWRRGWTIRYIPESVVHHRHRGTIGGRYSAGEVKRAMLKTQLLFHWKNLHDPEMLRRHLFGILLRLLDEDIRGDRAFLDALHLALQDFEKILLGRAEEAKYDGAVPITHPDDD